MADEDITLPGVLVSGKTYKVTFTITISSGTITAILGTKAGTARSAAGTYIEHIKANGTDFIFRTQDTSTLVVTSFSCVEFNPYEEGPFVMLDWSDDHGHNWGNEHFRNFGNTGEYAKRVRWHKLGVSRDRIFRIRISDPVKKVIISGHLDYEIGMN
jgi:hypothetical protein